MRVIRNISSGRICSKHVMTQLMVQKPAPSAVGTHCINSLWSPSRLYLRQFSNDGNNDSLFPKQIKIRLNEFQELFAFARMNIDVATDSRGTEFFEEDAELALQTAEDAWKYFEDLVKEITNIDEKNKVLRSNGLKVEQLKGILSDRSWILLYDDRDSLKDFVIDDDE